MSPLESGGSTEVNMGGANMTGNAGDFQDLYRKDKVPWRFKDVVQKTRNRVCNRKWAQNCAKRNLPILKTVLTYNFLRDLPSDLLSGVSVGIMQIPQSMAYALLATLPPICGLYSALFGPLVYMFLGTSNHISMGVITVVSLMVAGVLDRQLGLDGEFVPDTGDNLPTSYNDSSLEALDDKKVEIAVAMSFVSGATMIIFGKIGLGVVTTYMSEPLISGFTSGVAIHALTSQLKNIFGLRIRRYNGVFKIFKSYYEEATWHHPAKWSSCCLREATRHPPTPQLHQQRTLIEVFRNIPQTNVITLVTSLICIVNLYVIKVQVNERFRKWLRVPIPIDLIVLILGTVASYFLKLDETYDVTVVGDIPAGLPTPRVPSLSVMTDCLADAVVIGIIAFGQSVSVAKILARKHGYKINANQEMVAYGAGSVLCSVFSGYITAASVPRSFVQETTGGKTQIASVFSCVIVLVVIMAVGPLFHALPQCIIASILIVALRSMFLRVLETKRLWKTSKYDLAIWVLTYACVVILDADIGLGIGILFSILTVVIRTQISRPVAVGRVADTDKYMPEKLYKQVKETPQIKVIAYQSPLYFANAELFVSGVSKRLGVNLETAPDHTNNEVEVLPESTARHFPLNNNTAFWGDHIIGNGTISRKVADNGNLAGNEVPSRNILPSRNIDRPYSGISPGYGQVDTCGLSTRHGQQTYIHLSTSNGLIPGNRQSYVDGISLNNESPSSKKNSNVNHGTNENAQLNADNHFPPYGYRDCLDRGKCIHLSTSEQLRMNNQSNNNVGHLNPNYSSLNIANTMNNGSPNTRSCAPSKRLRFVIFDFSKVMFVDTVGVNALTQIISEYDSIGITVWMAECTDDVIDVMRAFPAWKDIRPRLFLSVSEAEKAASLSLVSNEESATPKMKESTRQQANDSDLLEVTRL